MFGAACTFFVLALSVFVVSRLAPAQKEGRKLDRRSGTYRQVRPRFYLSILTGGLAALAALFGSLSCVATVSTKNLGVLTTFGHPDGYLQNGFHLKRPWQKVNEINDAIQTDTYADKDCISVRIARQSTACVNVSIRWQIKGEGVDYLFRNYKSNDHITDNLVLRDLQTALNEAFVGYDPLGIDDRGLSTNKPLSAADGPSLAADILKHMQTNIGTWIDVYSVNIPIMTFDPRDPGQDQPAAAAGGRHPRRRAGQADGPGSGRGQQGPGDLGRERPERPHRQVPEHPQGGRRQGPGPARRVLLLRLVRKHRRRRPREALT
jgi:hypothetical protein